MDYLSHTWRSRLMRDYHQHLPMNCGGVAAVFALYGPSERVPTSMNEALSQERVSAMGVERIINDARRTRIRARAYTLGSSISISDYGGSRPTREEPIQFLEPLSEESVIEGIRDILTVNEARCVIISGRDRVGLHWQTFYLPTGGDTVSTYNERRGWAPAFTTEALGAPVGIILVRGPRFV